MKRTVKSGLRECLDCHIPLLEAHFNRVRCERCAKARVKRPIGRLTKRQERLARKLAGTMKQDELAARLGCSRSNLIRWARDAKVSLDSLSYKPELVRAVCSFYELHGKEKTQKAFPQVRVRSVVERYKLFKPRQLRWTDQQIVEAVKMSGLISWRSQAKYFNRPNAHDGSIKALWMKRFGFEGGSLNGMAHVNARRLIRNVGGARPYLRPVGQDRNGNPVQFRRIMLWVDLERFLHDEVPDFICEAVSAMADFQRWLWKSDDPKPLILKMIKERELYA